VRLFWPTVEMLVELPPWSPPLGLRLDARWFPCLGAFPQGVLAIDSDRLDLGAGLARGVVFQQGPGEPELCVFAFEGGCVEADLTIVGSRPVALLFRDSVRLGGGIDARCAGARRSGPGLAAAPGGGGGFGGPGGAPGGAGAGGPSYGLRGACEIGSGGQPGNSSGGLGGGGLQLGAVGRLELVGAWIDVSGGAGASARQGTAGGGGSGGSLVLHGREVRLDGPRRRRRRRSRARRARRRGRWRWLRPGSHRAGAPLRSPGRELPDDRWPRWEGGSRKFWKRWRARGGIPGRKT